MPYENYGPGVTGLRTIPGAPVAGTNAVQTLTIGGTPTGGTFRLSLEGIRTGSITWSGVNATLLAALQAQLDAVFGTNAIVATAGTLTAGIGTILLTFSGANYAKRVWSTMVVAENALTGTVPTLSVATTTAGVAATGRGTPTGSLFQRTDNGLLYSNTGTPQSPTLTVVGTQT